MNIERHPQQPNPLAVRVQHINSAGPLVKVKLATERGDHIHVEISHERYQELLLKKDDAVFVSPRDMRMF